MSFTYRELLDLPCIRIIYANNWH